MTLGFYPPDPPAFALKGSGHSDPNIETIQPMRSPSPKAIHLKDYTPPDFLIDRVDLLFELTEDRTRVCATLAMKRNPGAETQNRQLTLDGESLKLISVKVDGLPLIPGSYAVKPDALWISDVPDTPFKLEIVTEISPESNTALEGLYLSGGIFCTQCEAQGFRKITYFLDRPDVMAVYTTTLIADRKRYPVLLSNGNLAGTGDLLNGRHWARWVDPFPKPAYLFALVAGDLESRKDQFVTQSGRRVALQVFTEAHDIDKCDHALQSLKHAMRWDEEHYGREYDLDLYMIVAVSHFNMGAMENKGLNLFNTKYVLARPDTATDFDYEHVEGVIGHEYFHNWTGNRITCRDWFQLSLKEGLTVFRDQEFSADRHSRPVKRIDDVNMLRTRQFAEDAGPLAHPVRPESYIEINNFYTLTVYEKGAEVVRMMHTLLGAERFRKATDLYFTRHDGQAVTCEDLVRCMEDVTGLDLAQFRRWYTQAGTPEVTLVPHYRADEGVLELHARQHTPATRGQKEKLPLHIPLTIALLDEAGSPMPLCLDGEAEADLLERVLDFKGAEQTFRFKGLKGRPTVSAFRGFSAPIKLKMERSPEELGFLLARDTDAFNRWDAGQQLAARAILSAMDDADDAGSTAALLVDAFKQVLCGHWDDLSYLSLLIGLPSEDYLGTLIEVPDPVRIHEAREAIRRNVSQKLALTFLELYEQHHQDDYNQFDAPAIGRRRLKNICLEYLAAADNSASHDLAYSQFVSARSMTDRMAALTVIVNAQHPRKSECLERFFDQWKGEDLVVGKWFSVQATCRLAGTLDAVKRLTTHPAFDLHTPNHVRSLIGAFCQSNPSQFHAQGGEGYEFLADKVIVLNSINPQIAARMLTSLAAWKRFDPTRQQEMRRAIERVAKVGDLSPDVFEVASKALADQTETI